LKETGDWTHPVVASLDHPSSLRGKRVGKLIIYPSPLSIAGEERGAQRSVGWVSRLANYATPLPFIQAKDA